MPYFVSIILLILSSGLPCCLLALGIFLTYRLLDFADLTAEGSFLVGGALTASLISLNLNPIIATILGMIAGGLCGFITGILNTKLNIPKLLSGIITMTAATSIAMLIIGLSNGIVFDNDIRFNPSVNHTIYSALWINNKPQFNLIIEDIVFIVIVLIVAILIYFFFGTEYGMSIRATGMNEQMARAQGINSTRATIVCVALSNALIGLAGALYAQDQHGMNIKDASGFLVVGLASILIGESIFGKKNFKRWMISVLLGAIVYFIIIQIALELGFPSGLMKLLYAVLITIALCLPLFKKLFKQIFSKKGDSHVSN